jgi:hypothetical protein
VRESTRRGRASACSGDQWWFAQRDGKKKKKKKQKNQEKASAYLENSYPLVGLGKQMATREISIVDSATVSSFQKHR